MKKSIVSRVINIENSKTLKYITLVISINCDKRGNNDDTIFKEEESIVIYYRIIIY